MASSKIKDLTLKSPIGATDEFVINDAAGGNLDKKVNTSGISTFVIDNLPYGTSSGTICQGNDSRLSDSRTPLSHSHTQSEITNLVTDLSNKSAVGHTHTKTSITDFTHTHPQSEITSLVTDLGNKSAVGHVHVKADISDFTHTHIKSEVGLSNVDNTSDASKPVSTATQTALDLKQNSLGFTAENISNRAAVNGYASLDASTKIPIAQIPTGSTSTAVCIGNDSRLSDSRTPLSHTHAESEITNLTTDLSSKYSANNRQTAIITSEISNNQITIPKMYTIGESVEANSAHSLTAANMVTKSILTCTPTVARIFTSDTAANIIALIGSVTGNWFEFTIVSKAAFTITLATNTGLTLSGNLVCAASSSATFIGIVTGASTMSIFRK